jgi:putative ATP-dependent endonuclease of the OLD family
MVAGGGKMHIVRLTISGFRGVQSADITLGRHSVLVGPNNSGKTTITEALALLFGRDRLVRRLTEHDFYGSAPEATTRILIMATVTGFPNNDPQQNTSWFAIERGVEKWLDPKAKTISAEPNAKHTELAVEIGFAARFDLDELEAETVRFFVDDEATLGDPFAEDAHLRIVHTRTLQELGFYLVPASRTWDRWISFSSELFRRVVTTRGGMPAQAVRAERERLWNPSANRLEDQPGLADIVSSANDELRHLLPSAPQLKLRLTGTDSESVLEAVIPHFSQGTGPTLPATRQGTGLTSLQSLLLLMQFGKARAETGRSFILAVEEPELHIQPSQQRRLVNRLNALCDQTIVTTHSPLVAAMFPPADTLFIETSSGTLTAKPLMKTMPAAPTNHQQHLLYAWREKLVASLMHECVLIPEGVSDVAWLEALQTALELQQGWTETQGNSSRFATFVGVVPTIDAKIADTFTLINQVHARPCILVDGDPDGRGYFDAVKVLAPPPKCVLFWQQGRSIEHVIAWIAAADEVNVLAALGSSLGHNFATAAELVTFLLGQKSYAPTHESASVTLMGNRACRTRATQLLGAMCDLLHAPASATSNLFQRVSANSTSTMHVFRFSP